jgi:hypothetical protein
MNFTKSKISLGLFSLIAFIAINSFAVNVSAQEGEPIPKGKPRCTSTVEKIYFVDSGKSVTEVHPGSNGGNGYQLNIIGKNVDKFEVVLENYMTSVAVIPNYTNSTSAKWQIFFVPNMGQVITSIKMKSKCGSTETKVYQLTESVTLLDQ